MNYSYINHDSVASLIKSSAIPGKDYQIVDVRGKTLALSAFLRPWLSLTRLLALAIQTRTLEEATFQELSTHLLNKGRKKPFKRW